MNRIKKILLLSALSSAFILSSCIITSDLRKPEPVEKEKATGASVQEEVVITADDLIIDEDIGDSRVVEIYKDEIQDNCERKFLDLFNYYRNGELLASKILFDNLLESLEYQYGDKKVSDTVMLQNFWDEFSDQNIKNSDADIFEIYQSLYFDEALFNKEPENTELVVEQKSEAVSVKQNNSSYIYVEEKATELLKKFGKNSSQDFIRSVYESYNNYLNDRIGIKETYIRSQKYISFIKKKLKDAELDEIFCYIPGMMTSYYNGKNNGGIWRLDNDRDYRNIRSDVGASTAEVVKSIKALNKKGDELKIIATILEEGRYRLSDSELLKDIFTEDLSDFIALVIIISSPEDHDLKGSEIDGNDEKEYLASYDKYLKDPKEFKTSNSSSNNSSSKSSKYSKSFIRINYKVRKGDNLDKIADLFDVKISELKKWNPKDTSKKYLYPGVTLFIQGYGFQYYVAKNGDSIGKICKKHKMSESDFKKINGLSRNTIYKGRKYIVKK